MYLGKYVYHLRSTHAVENTGTSSKLLFQESTIIYSYTKDKTINSSRLAGCPESPSLLPESSQVSLLRSNSMSRA